MSPRLLGDAPGADRSEDRPKGFLSTSTLVYHAGTVLVRVVSLPQRTRPRRVRHRRRGGAARILRRHHRSRVVGPDEAAGGTRLLRRRLRPRRPAALDPLAPFADGGPPLSVVAHTPARSTPAAYSAMSRTSADRNQPAGNLRFKNLLLMAPACDFARFASVLAPAAFFETPRASPSRARLESGYWEVPAIYPLSALSGFRRLRGGGRAEATRRLRPAVAGHGALLHLPQNLLAGRCGPRATLLRRKPACRQVWSVDLRDGLGRRLPSTANSFLTPTGSRHGR